jgi:hypothetical protein
VSAAGAISGTGSGSGFTSGATTGSTGQSGAGSGYDGGPTDFYALCKPVAAAAGSKLPFIVDNVYVPSGWMGDAPNYPATPGDPSNGIPAFPARSARMRLEPVGYNLVNKDACTPNGVGRAPGAPAGAGCWKVTFVPFPKTIQPLPNNAGTKIGGGPGQGWAGAFWQYPQNNWGAPGGYLIPPSSTAKVTFWARGSIGHEAVRFFSGEGSTFPCADIPTSQLNAVLSTQWQKFTIDMTGIDYSAAAGQMAGLTKGSYFGGVLGAFGFGVGDQPLNPDGGAIATGPNSPIWPSAPPNDSDPDGGAVMDPAVPGMAFPPYFDATVVFYIDDIEFSN